MGLEDKFAKISGIFDLSEEVCEEMNEEIVTIREEHKEAIDAKIVESDKTQEYVLDNTENKSIVRFDQLHQDFNISRETLLGTVKSGRRLIESLSDSFIDSDGDVKASSIEAFASLTNAVNQSLKLLTSIYLETTKVEESIKRLNSGAAQLTENGDVTNIQNNFGVAPQSTEEIIAKLRADKEN